MLVREAFDASVFPGDAVDVGPLVRGAREAEVLVPDALSADVFLAAEMLEPEEVGAGMLPRDSFSAGVLPCAAPDPGALARDSLRVDVLPRPDGNGALKRDAPGTGATVAVAGFAAGAVIAGAGGRFGEIGGAEPVAGFDSERSTAGTDFDAGFSCELATDGTDFAASPDSDLARAGSEFGLSAAPRTASLNGEPRLNATPIGSRAGVVKNVPDCALCRVRPAASEPAPEDPAGELPSELDVTRPAPEPTGLRIPTLDTGAAGGCVTCAAGGGGGL